MEGLWTEVGCLKDESERASERAVAGLGGEEGCLLDCG
jgi:hypothetical protein